MKKLFTKLISLLLAIMMVVGMIPANVFATGQGVQPEDTDVEVPIVTTPSTPADPEGPTEEEDTTNVVLGERYTCTIDEAAGVCRKYFIPETSGWYMFVSYGDEDTFGSIYLSETEAEIMRNDDSDVGTNFNARAYLYAEYEYIFEARFLEDYKTGSFEAAVYELEEITLDQQKEVTLAARGGATAFSFTPDETGMYSFYANDGFDGSDGDVARLNIKEAGTYWEHTGNYRTCPDFYMVSQTTLQAGKSYALFVWNDTYSSDETVTVSVTKADAEVELSARFDSVNGKVSENSYIELLPVSPKVNMENLPEIAWEIEDPEIAAIEENGLICYYELLAAGSTVITATVGEDVYTFPVTVTALPALSLDQEVQVQAVPNNYEPIYTFTAPEDGVYGFYTYHNYEEPYGLDVEVIVNGLNWMSGASILAWDNINELQLELEAGDVCNIRLDNWTDFTLDAYLGVVECPDAAEVVFAPNPVVGYPTGWSDYIQVDYAVYPVHANLRGMTWGTSDEELVEVSGWDRHSAYLRLHKVGNGTIGMILTGGTFELPVQILDYPVLELNTEVEVTSQRSDDRQTYLFTAPEAGVYAFYVESGTDYKEMVIVLDDASGARHYSSHYGQWGTSDIYLQMEEGEQCYIHLYSSVGNAAVTSTVGVVKAPAPTSISVSKARVVEYLEEENGWNSVQIDIQPAHADVTSIEWVSGDENVVLADGSGNWFEYQVQGIGETVVTATYGGEILAEIPVLVTQPQEIEPDVTIRLDDVVWGAPYKFTFTPTESDVYSFYSVSDDNNYRLEVYVYTENDYYDGTWHSEWGTEDVQLYMEAGKTYTLGAACYYGDRAVSGSVCLTRSPDATEIQVDVESVSVYLDNSWRRISAKAFPAHADMTALVWSSDNEEIVTVESYGHYCSYLVNKAGTANITVTAGDATNTIPVEGKAMPVLEEGISQYITCVGDDGDVYLTFTPAESGVYTFYQDNMWCMNLSVSLQTHNWTYGQTYEPWGCDYVQGTLTAGQEYSIVVYSTMGGDYAASCNIGVVKAPAITAMTTEQSGISGYAAASWIGMSMDVQPMYADLSQITVSSSDEQIVQAHYSDGQLNYQLVSAGIAEITVTAGDAVLTIPVEVTAIPSVELDEVFICDITYSGQEVYRTFTPAVTGVYEFRHLNDGDYLDTYGTIYNEDMGYVASNDDGGGNGSFQVITLLEAGKTYTLGARMYGAGLNSFNAVIRMVDATQLSVGEQSVYIDPYTTQSFLFTAESSGTHVFYVLSDEVQFTVTSPRGTWYGNYYDAWASTDAFFYMEAGETAVLNVTTYNHHIDTNLGVALAGEATSIVFDREELSGFAGNDGSVRITAMPAHSVIQDMVCESSDPDVVEVSGGSISLWYWLRSVGTAQITVTVGGTAYTLPVTVNEIPTINAGEEIAVSMAYGEEMKYTFTPTETGVYSFYAEDVTAGMVELYIRDENDNWLTNGQAFGPGYVDPSRDAQYQLEAGVTYHLTAYANWEDIDCTLGIVKAPEVTEITIDGGDLYESYVPGGMGSYRIDATILPAHADLTQLEWSVADEEVAAIEYEWGSYCYIVITGPGTTQLTVTAGSSVSATMNIYVRQVPEIELGEEYVCVDDEHYNDHQFLFTPETTGLYHAYTAGEGSTQIWLYELVQYEDWLDTVYFGSSGYGAEGSNALMTQHLEAGKTYLYYVEEHWNVESFTFRITDPEPVTELSFYADTVFGFPGASQWLNYKLEPFTADESTIELTSSDDAVVMVQENGSILLVGAGTATLTATAASGVSDTCTVTVKEQMPLTLNSEKAVTVIPELNCEKFYFIPSVAGTYIIEAKGPMGSKLLYASSENGIDVGNESRGDVKIQFTAEAGERVDIILEAYYAYPADFTVKVTSPNAATGISFAQGSSISGLVHSISKLSVNFAPAGAAEEDITWTSDNEEVAIVEYGYVTIVGAGRAVITAETESGLTASCTVTGTEPETITVSETRKVDVEVPGDTGVFKFVPESTTTYVVRSIGNAETYLEILDEDGNYVGAVNYALRAAYGIVGNSGDVVELEAGKTYYVRASMTSNSVGAFKVLIEEHLGVVGFEITRLPDQTECYRDGSVSMRGLELKVEWSDGSFTDYSYNEGGDLGDASLDWSISSGRDGMEISLYISDISRSFTVPYATKTVTGIRIIDSEEAYVVEYGDGYWYCGKFYYYLPTELLGAEITYSDGSTKTVENLYESVDGAWIESYYNSSLWEVGGDNTVTFEYMGVETQYNVRIVESAVESITVNAAPSRVYTFGDEEYGWINDDGSYEIYSWNYDLTGISLTVKYTDGSSATFTYEDIEGSEYSAYLYMGGFPIGFSNLEAAVGKNTVTVNYLNAETTYQITVVEPTVKYVQVVKAPDVIPTEYGFTSNGIGMQLKLTYTDDTTKVITVTEDNVTYEYAWQPKAIITDDDVEIRVVFESYYGQLYADVSCGSFYSYQLIAETVTSYNVEDIEITGVSATGSSVDMKLTYMDGTVEEMTLTPVEGTNATRNSYSFRGVASTDKGLLTYNVWMYQDRDGNVVEYEVYVMDQYFYIAAPEVPDVVVGDPNGDGVVDGMDATLLLQYAAGWDVQIDEAAGDANGDGVVDGMDATLLLQYAAGWDVTLGNN